MPGMENRHWLACYQRLGDPLYLISLRQSPSPSSPQLSIFIWQQSTSFGLEAFVRARYNPIHLLLLKLYLNFLFWYSFYLYLFSIALTTPLNLGGYITDYQYTARIQIQLACILTRLPTRSLTRLITQSITPLLSTPFIYIFYLISIDLESSRSLNSPALQSLHLSRHCGVIPYLDLSGISI